MKNPSPHVVDQYIEQFPQDVQARLQSVRKTIAKLAPRATEVICYGIPTFKLHGNLVHFAGYARHLGFYPGAAGIAAFQRELAAYKHAKGSVQFPHDRPLPLALIKKIVRFRIQQNETQATTGAASSRRAKKAPRA